MHESLRAQLLTRLRDFGFSCREAADGAVILFDTMAGDGGYESQCDVPDALLNEYLAARTPLSSTITTEQRAQAIIDDVAAQVLETMQSEGGAVVQRFGLRQVGHAVEWFSVRQDGPALNVAPDPEGSYWSAHSNGP